MKDVKVYRYPETSEWSALLSRPQMDATRVEDTVKTIFDAVAQEGDNAVLRYTRAFDNVTLEALPLTPAEIQTQAAKVPQALKAAIDLAYQNIYAFHEAQRTGPVHLETMPGVECWQEKKAIDKVGIYIPGGTAPLFSTVLMLAIPARIAGCREVVLCSPPDRDGSLHPAICYAAWKCGVTTLCKAGGIQAIAAMTFGTASIPAVYKIFGPGNQYVTQAKQWATRLGVAIDMPAGPSELMVVADQTAYPEFVASDLLSQAEHGPDSQVLLLTDQPDLPARVQEALGRQLEALPRKEIARAALENSTLVVLSGKQELADMINAYGPEHLIIAHRDEDFLLGELRNAGSVFLGNYSPESAGDYASGTNHTLPTHGYARQYSGVNLDHFTKAITYQRIQPDGIRVLGPAVEEMAAAEGLQAHKNAVTLRLQALNVNTRTP
ncbi:histidinol dehydrogenase [Robiginitalea sp. M366]|uniref:histidinol dehydrogenase n=1 Tax=Robiginitalea aestuariiviva TaxID=3036903 RepID=UPI00240D5EE5|nr:histidinol dehydrogenase [Robiginitalea aestuariiviva]MDG1572965.1 histidinol dehydrogenase [Robiginitalea aestuariiviva]